MNPGLTILPSICTSLDLQLLPPRQQHQQLLNMMNQSIDKENIISHNKISIIVIKGNRRSRGCIRHDIEIDGAGSGRKRYGHCSWLELLSRTKYG